MEFTIVYICFKENSGKECNKRYGRFQEHFRVNLNLFVVIYFFIKKFKNLFQNPHRKNKEVLITFDEKNTYFS